MGRKTVLSSMMVGALTLGLLAGCTQSTKAPEPSKTPTTDATGVPAGYPAAYKQIIEDSKKENSLLIYSNMSEANWKPSLDAFAKLYPWIKVQTLDLGSGEVFDRYLSEKSSGTKTADLLVSASPDQFIDLVKTRQETLAYESPEKKNLPAFGNPMPGLYTVSTDPMIIIYNKKLLAENQRPDSLGKLAELAKANPTLFNGKITTYDITSAFGYAINWAYVRDRGDATWKTLEGIGPMAKPEKSGGPMVEKVTTGEYVAGYFVSGITVFPKLEQLKDVLGWSYIKDGAPLFLRGVTIPKTAKSTNAAKLMLDFMLTHDGQVTLGKGGLVPYRADVKESEVPRTYATVVKEIGGEDKAVLINYDEKSAASQKGFQAKWTAAFKR
jgi:iron(III) transport system substrate-binding protein